jgi:hypothetical protein
MIYLIIVILLFVSYGGVKSINTTKDLVTFDNYTIQPFVDKLNESSFLGFYATIARKFVLSLLNLTGCMVS